MIPKIDPGHGWRLLDPEKDTRQEGDEFYDESGEWLICQFPRFFDNILYRRRIDPGEGYRILERNELLDGTEDSQCVWSYCGCIRCGKWLLTGLRAGEPQSGGVIYRRKIAPPPEKAVYAVLPQLDQCDQFDSLEAAETNARQRAVLYGLKYTVLKAVSAFAPTYETVTEQRATGKVERVEV